MIENAMAFDLHLSASERELRDRCERLGRHVFTPIAARAPHGELDRQMLLALSEHGLLATLFGEAERRGQVSAMTLCLVREGLARGCTQAETAFALQGLGFFPVILGGRAQLLGDWFDEVSSGRAAAAFALSEPQAGSDVAALAMHAEPDGDGFRLHGEKLWISNAPDADIYTVFARTQLDAGAHGLTAFAVPGDSDGLSGERRRLIAPHAVGALTFDGVRVTRGQMLGELNRGFALAMRTLDLFRPSVGAFALGMARAALDSATAHAASRRAFGRTLSQFQAVSHRLADLNARLQAATLLVWQAAKAYDEGAQPRSVSAAMAKLVATELAQEVVDAAIQVHGAQALEEGHLLEHLYRDVRAPRIYEGASEVQREIIARSLFSDGRGVQQPA